MYVQPLKLYIRHPEYTAVVHLTLGNEKKNFGSGQLIFENWSGGTVDLFSFFFLNYNKNLPNLVFQQVIKLEIETKPVLI